MSKQTELKAIAIAEALRELKSVPNGEFYARVMSFMDVHEYNAIIASLKTIKLIDEHAHVLTWIGPRLV